MPQLDITTYSSQLFWLCISFLILFLGVRFYFSPKIEMIFRSRDMTLRKTLVLAKRLKREIEQLESAIHSQESSARSHAHNLLIQTDTKIQKTILEKKREIELHHNQELFKFEQELKRSLEAVFSNTAGAEKELTQILLKKLEPSFEQEEELSQSLKKGAS